MKKLLFVLLSLTLLLVGCTSELESAVEDSTYRNPDREHERFDGGDYFKITNADVYALTDKETGCKYIVVSEGDNDSQGSAITPLLKSDGTPDCSGDISGNTAEKEQL